MIRIDKSFERCHLPIIQNLVRLRTFMKNKFVSFDNTEVAFASKSNADLKRAYWLFSLLKYPWLVRVAPYFIRAALWLHLPIKGLVRATAFRQFCGGESIAGCENTIRKLAASGIGTILDFSVEGKETEHDFESGLQETLATIERSAGDAHIPFSVFKPTAFARNSLLEKHDRGETLTASEQSEYASFVNRIEKICQRAFERNVPVFIDAEESWIQDSIDTIAQNMMMKYNKKDVIVYNTLQMYRTGRVDYLNKSLEHARENGYLPGFKIVRGAYMEKERKRAAKLNLPSPIQPDKESTDRDYNEALRIIVDHIDIAALCCGTHNESSSLLLVELMHEKKLSNNHPRIWFSQLLGMSDHISYNLSQKGYRVCKYVPYGPVESVLPYLVRRARENTSVKGQTGRELSLLRMEVRRRKENNSWE